MHTTASAIVDEVIVELPAAPARPMVNAALAAVVAEFLDRTHAARAELDAIDIVAEVYLYTLALPDEYRGYRIGKPAAVVLSGEELRAGIDYRMASRTSLQLRDMPQEDATGALEVTATLALDDIHEADLSPLEEWYAAIASGVKFKMMAMPRRPWTDQQSAAYYRTEYFDGLSRAMLSAVTDGNGKPQRLSV